MLSDWDIEPGEFHLVVFTSISIMLYIQMFVRTISMIFILNFGGGGLNLTILLFFATISGFLYIIVANFYYPHTLRFFQTTFILGSFALILTLVANPIWSLVFSVLYQIIITPALISAIIILKKRFAVAAALGILINMTILSLTNFVSFYTSVLGTVLLIFSVAIWLSEGLYLTKQEILEDYETTRLSSTSALIGFLGMQAVILSFPNVVSTWYQSNLLLIIFLSLLAISLSIGLIFDIEQATLRQQSLVLVGYLLGLVIVVYFENFLYYGGVFLLQATSILVLAIGIRDNATESIKVLGVKMGAVQFLMMTLIFLMIATPFWIGLPTFLHPLLRDSTQFYLLILGFILPVSGGLSVYLRYHS